jgi:hypothetical protein
MSNNAVQSHYFSGQGVVMLAERSAAGRPLKLRPVGNVSDLKITLGSTVVEHKESQTGQRGTDLRLQTGVAAGVAMTIENFDRLNLAQALRGDIINVAGAALTAEAGALYVGGVAALRHINISSYTVKEGATTLIEFVDDSTPYDYKAYADGGSFLFNDGTTLAFSAAGVAATAITVGATTAVTVASTAGAYVGGTINCRGFTGADAADINGKNFLITEVTSGTSLKFSADTTADTITATGSPKVVWDGTVTATDYTYSDQFTIGALENGISDIWMRFEGLNTAEDNRPVVVEVFRFSTDPLKELALISDTVGNFALEGSALLDALQLTGSKYFRITMLD